MKGREKRGRGGEGREVWTMYREREGGREGWREGGREGGREGRIREGRQGERITSC